MPRSPAAARPVEHRDRADLGVHVDTVRKWRRRFCQHRLGRSDRLPRSGATAPFSAVQVTGEALACELPADTVSRWRSGSCPDLAAKSTRRGVVASVFGLPPCVAGWPPMRSSPGSTGPGSPRRANPTSPESWSCAGPVRRFFDGDPVAPMSTCSPREKPACRPGSGSTQPGGPPQDEGRCWSSRKYRRHGHPGLLAATTSSAQVIGHCAPRQHRTLHRPGHQCDDLRALRQARDECSGSSTTAPPIAADRPARLADAFPKRGHDPTRGARVLAKPDRDLLLRRPSKLLTPDNVAISNSWPNRSPHSKPGTTTPPQPFDWRFNRDDL